MQGTSTLLCCPLFINVVAFYEDVVPISQRVNDGLKGDVDTIYGRLREGAGVN